MVQQEQAKLLSQLSPTRLEDFCRRWKIAQLWLFGSAVTGRFSQSSDFDFLYQFEDDAPWSLFDVATLVEEFEGLLGRRIHFVSKRAIERDPNWLRRKEILGSAKSLYAS